MLTSDLNTSQLTHFHPILTAWVDFTASNCAKKILDLCRDLENWPFYKHFSSSTRAVDSINIYKNAYPLSYFALKAQNLPFNTVLNDKYDQGHHRISLYLVASAGICLFL